MALYPATTEIIQHSELLCRSFQHWLGKPLLPSVVGQQLSPEAQAQALFEAPFVVVSHGTQADPIFNYGNAKALELWELDWEALTTMPSRETAEGEEQPDREKMLEQAKAQGYFDGYVGDRTTGSGKRFRMEDGLIWTLLDEAGNYRGQAARFSQYYFLT